MDDVLSATFGVGLLHRKDAYYFLASYLHSTIALQILTHRSELRDRISGTTRHGNNEKFLGLSRTLTLTMYR